MSSNWENIALLTICINIFIYIGAGSTGTYLLEGGVIQRYFVTDFTQDNFLNDSSQSNLNINEKKIELPDQVTQESETGGFSFFNVLDALQLVYSIIIEIFNLLFGSLVLFKLEGIPYVIPLLISVPLTMSYWFSLVRLIRGA